MLPESSSDGAGQVATVAQFPTRKRSDASLVQGAAGGDQEAIAAIWDRYSGLVRGVIYGALGPDQAVEDLTQDVFLAFLGAAGRIKDGHALKGYLASMGVRHAVQEIRRRKVRRWVGLSPTSEVPELPTKGEDSEGRAALAALHRVLQQLSERRRMAFVLRHVQGFEMLEAAQALGVSESTLRRELQAAKIFIRNAAGREPALGEVMARYEGAWS